MHKRQPLFQNQFIQRQIVKSLIFVKNFNLEFESQVFVFSLNKFAHQTIYPSSIFLKLRNKVDYNFSTLGKQILGSRVLGLGFQPPLSDPSNVHRGHLTPKNVPKANCRPYYLSTLFLVDLVAIRSQSTIFQVDPIAASHFLS